MARWLVSAEGASTPLRTAVLKHLQSSFGLVVSDTERSANPFALLLHRLVSLSKAGDSVLCCGSWTLAQPEHPVLRRLHADLARELAARLELAGHTCQLMVCLQTDVNECFEAALLSEDARHVTLEQLRTADATVRTAGLSDTASPFPLRVVRVDCPPFAADNPITLIALLDLVVKECKTAMESPCGATSPGWTSERSDSRP